MSKSSMFFSGRMKFYCLVVMALLHSWFPYTSLAQETPGPDTPPAQVGLPPIPREGLPLHSTRGLIILPDGLLLTAKGERSRRLVPENMPLLPGNYTHLIQSPDGRERIVQRVGRLERFSRDGRLLGQLPMPLDWKAPGLLYAPDGTWFLRVANADNGIEIEQRDAKTLRLTRRYTLPDTSLTDRDAVALRLDAQGHHLLIGARGGAYLIDLTTGKTRFRLRPAGDQPGRVQAVAFSADGKTMVTLDLDSGLECRWERKSGAQLQCRGGPGWPLMRLSRDGEQSIRAFEKAALVTRGMHTLTLSPETLPLVNVRFSHDGRIIFQQERDRVRLFDSSSGTLLAVLVLVKPAVGEWEGHWLLVMPSGLFESNAPLHTLPLLFSNNGRKMPFAQLDGGVLKELEQHLLRPGLLAALLRGEREFPPPGTLSLPPLEQTSSRIAGEIRSDSPSPSPLNSAPSRSPQRNIAGHEASPTFDDTGNVRLELQVANGHAGIRSAAYSRDGRLLVTGGADATAVLWEASSGRVLRRFKEHSGEVSDVAFLPDGRRLLTLDDVNVTLWNAVTGERQQRFPHLLPRTEAREYWSTHKLPAISPDGRYCVLSQEPELSSENDPEQEPELSSENDPAQEPEPSQQNLLQRIWQLETGRLLHTFTGQERFLTWTTDSPDRAIMLVTTRASTCSVDLETGKRIQCVEVRLELDSFGGLYSQEAEGILREWRTTNGRLSRGSKLYIPPGTTLLGLTTDGFKLIVDHGVPFMQEGHTLEIFEANTGNYHGVLEEQFIGQLQRTPDPSVLLMTIRSNGRSAARSYHLYHLETEESLPIAEWGKEMPYLSGDGRFLMLVGEGRSRQFEILDTRAGLHPALGVANRPELELATQTPTFAAFSPTDASTLLLGSGGGAFLWNLTQAPFPLMKEAHAITSASFTREGHIFARWWAKDAVIDDGLFDVSSGRWLSSQALDSLSYLEHRNTQGSAMLRTAASPYGRRIFTVFSHRNGVESHSNLESDLEEYPRSLSPDGRLWMGDAGGIRSTRDGKLRCSVEGTDGDGNLFRPGLFSPDGASLLAMTDDYALRLWNTRDCAVKSTFYLPVYEDSRYSLAFSPDGSVLAVGGRDGVISVAAVATGKTLATFQGHSGPVRSVALSPTGDRLISVGEDGTTRLWDVTRQLELCKLFTFLDGSWAVIDPEGRYDASNGGDVKGVYFVVNLDIIELQQLKERFYEPGLLGKLLGLNPEPPRRVSAFQVPRLYPAADISLEPTDDELPALRITLRERGGGFGPVSVFLNGREVLADARPKDSRPANGSWTWRVDLSPFSRLLTPAAGLEPGTRNRVAVVVQNEEGYLTSRPVQLDYPAPRASSRGTLEEQEGVTTADLTVPTLWALVVGTSDYSGEQLDLRFAAQDAEDMAEALELAGRTLFGPDRVHITLLTTTGGKGQGLPTHESIVIGLQEIEAKATATDLLVVYLAGHGVLYGGQEGDYYYLTSDARTGDLTDTAVREQVALSSMELTDQLKRIPASKQVLILDTCQSGAVVERLTASRHVSSSQMRALERMKDRVGLFVLAGSAANAVSYEASHLGQGLLTYSLLSGLQGEALQNNGLVDVSVLFQFAADRVPRLAEGIGGIQRPQLVSPRAGSFALGQVLEADRARIPVASPVPRFVQSRFQEQQTWLDALGLEAVVDEALRRKMDAGAPPPLVFADTALLPEALRIQGRYRQQDGSISAEVRLYRASTLLGTFSVKGKTAAMTKMADEIVEAALKVIQE